MILKETLSNKVSKTSYFFKVFIFKVKNEIDFSFMKTCYFFNDPNIEKKTNI